MIRRINREESRMVLLKRALVAIVLVCSLAGSALLVLQAQAPQAKTVNDGVYTDEQAVRGQAIYKARCASCHGDTLTGRVGPALAGDDFLAKWSAQPLADLAAQIRNTMPKDDSPRLTRQGAADVVAYMLQIAKFPSGRAELPVDEAALARVNFPGRAGTANGPSAAAQLPSLPAQGNVAQVMRGILFPSANIIFTVQSIDPGVKKTPPKEGTPTATGGFDWFTWGGTVYTGWDVVDYAAVSLGESASLMLTPGRACENGKPVPVSDPDWIKFTLELAEAGKAAYKASQTRNQETVSDFTNQLNDSCMHCHRVFRGRTHCVK
jgi:mono/diheme cytochrome c family protein